MKWETSEAVLAKVLLEKGAIKFGSFTLKNPALSPSPVYMDLRTQDNPKPGPLGGEDMEKIAKELFRMVSASGIEYDFVCGIPNAGEPIAEAFRGLLDKGKQYKARLIKRGSGDSRRVSRFRICTRAKAKQTAKRVLLLDDVVSGADSKLEAIEAVKKAGYEIVAIAIAIDREQGGAEYLEKLGYKVFCWKGLSELLSFYYLLGVISWHRRAEVLKYIERTKLTIAPS